MTVDGAQVAAYRLDPASLDAASHDAGPAGPLSSDPAAFDVAAFANAAGLLDHGHSALRRLALDVAGAGLRAADPSLAVDRLVGFDGRVLTVAGRSYDLSAARSVVVLGAGKASLPIAAALERTLGDRIDRGLVVGRTGSHVPLDHVDLMTADHPVPTEASLTAGQRLLELADSCGPDDLVITAFTGGSSALACVPPVGVPFTAKQELHALLLDSGAAISEVNAVRKHVSSLKGGRLAARLGGATIVNLTLSDVVGDAVDLLCDVVVQDTSEVDTAREVLQRYGLWDAVHPSVRGHLQSPAAESPALGGLDITTCVLVTGSTVVTQMADRVRAHGQRPVVLGSSLEGEAAGLGGFLGALATGSAGQGEPFPSGAVLVGAGGEATVSIRRAADTVVGSGGPNQEVAISFARTVGAATVPVAAVFIDSDGSDGGTDAAGGCVDSTTGPRAHDCGLDLDAAIRDHDARAALSGLGDLVMTGPTGTNISDLIVVAIGGAQ